MNQKSKKNQKATRSIDQRVSNDVMKYFEHLPNLKRVEPLINGFSVCTFDSKMNFKKQHKKSTKCGQ